MSHTDCEYHDAQLDHGEHVWPDPDGLEYRTPCAMHVLDRVKAFLDHYPMSNQADEITSLYIHGERHPLTASDVAELLAAAVTLHRIAQADPR